MTLGPSGPLNHRRVPQVGPQGNISSPWVSLCIEFAAGHYILLLKSARRHLGVWGGGAVKAYLSLFFWGSREKVTLPKVREALMTIDPKLDKQTLNSYLSQAFQLPVTELPEEPEEKTENIIIQLQTVLERLQMADVRRTGPREQEPVS